MAARTYAAASLGFCNAMVWEKQYFSYFRIDNEIDFDYEPNLRVWKLAGMLKPLAKSDR